MSEQIEARRLSGEDCAPDCDERDNCADAGKVGHWQCGHCETHDRPRHHCFKPECLVTVTGRGQS